MMPLTRCVYIHIYTHTIILVFKKYSQIKKNTCMNVYKQSVILKFIETIEHIGIT